MEKQTQNTSIRFGAKFRPFLGPFWPYDRPCGQMTNIQNLQYYFPLQCAYFKLLPIKICGKTNSEHAHLFWCSIKAYFRPFLALR